MLFIYPHFSVMSQIINEEENVKSFETITGTYGAFALGTLNNEKSREALVDILFYHINPEDMEAKYAALLALGKSNDKSIVPFISTMLNDDFFDERLRICAALTLGRLGDDSVLPELRKGLESKTPNIRSAIVIALGMLKKPETKDDLIKIYTQDKSIEVKAYALIALAKLGDEFTYPIIANGAKNNDYTLRNTATIALGILANKESKRIIGNILAKGPKEVNYNAAIIASGLAGNKTDVNNILNTINTSQNVSTWQYSIEALGLVDAKLASQTLESIFKSALPTVDIDDDAFNSLVISLAKLGKTTEILSDLFKSFETAPGIKKPAPQAQQQSPKIKIRNLRAIGYIGNIDAIKTLMALYKSESNDKIKLQALFSISLILDSDKITPFYREELLLE